jgi:thiamine-phosphate pyrophosphorylase
VKRGGDVAGEGAFGASSLKLVVIVDLPPEGAPPLDRVRAAIRGGATLIQARGKRCTARALLTACRLLLPVCREAGVPLFVNDRPDLALAAGADGAHVGPDDLPPEAARRILGGRALGVSARSMDRVRLAEAARASYLGVGALRVTGSKTEAPVIGLDGIRAMVAATRLPVVAIGGVRPEDAAILTAIGVCGIAVVSGVMGAEDSERAARAYREAWDGA